MRFDAILRNGLATLLVISLGGCATPTGPNPGICAAVGGGLGAVGGGIGGYVYSHDNHERDHNQLEGAAIGLSSMLVGAGVGYLVCHLMQEEPKPEPRHAAPTPAPPPKPAPPPPVTRKPDACTERMRLDQVQFGNDKSDITPKSAAVLDEVVASLKNCPETRVRLNAYTDSSGSEAYNQALSQRRADSVRSYLVQHGISANRIEARGLGESNPVATNETPEGRAQNRRVEIEPIL